MAGISEVFDLICGELVRVLHWVLNSDRLNVGQFPQVAENLKTKLKNLYTCGREELQPGRLDAFSSLEESITTGGLFDSHDIGNQLVELVVKCFKEEWKGPLLIMVNVEICRGHLTDISGAVDKSSAVQICRKILITVSCIIDYYSKEHLKEATSAKASTILLCWSQIKTNLPLFLSGIEKECPLVQKYSAHCLLECLERIKKESCEKSDLTCSEFIELMDLALCELDELVENTSQWISQCENMRSLKTFVDELLCHAMSTAQVAVNEDDRQSILCKAQVILRALESLKDDLTGDDVPAIRLSAQTVSDALCGLERAVNASVLRLVLHTGSGSRDPLSDLVAMCHPQVPEEAASGKSETSSSLSNHHKASDLDDLIVEFDSHMDRLIQIGTFAVSCSSNVKKAVQIKSCLASFESLEAELVPCVTALYLDPTRDHKRNLRLFINHWLQETATFRAILDTIVDPAAYTDVVKDYISECIQELDKSENGNVISIVQKATKTAQTLHGVIRASIHQDCPQHVTSITVLAQRVTKATENCERLVGKLRCSELTGNEEALKRVRILSTAVEDLWEFLARQLVQPELQQSSGSVSEPSMEDITPKVLLPQKNYYQLCPTDVEITKNSEQCLLTPHMAKSNPLIKGAILYNTPKRSTIKRNVRETPMVRSLLKRKIATSVARSRCFRSAASKTIPETKELSDMELTALLDDLTRLDSTFSLDQTLLPHKVSHFHGRRLLDLFSSWDSLQEETTDVSGPKNGTQRSELPGSTCASNDVETPERVRDLILVGEKIEKLKMSQELDTTLP